MVNVTSAILWMELNASRFSVIFTMLSSSEEISPVWRVLFLF